MPLASGECQWTLLDAYRIDIDEALNRLKSSSEGLSDQESLHRLSLCGHNALPIKQPRGWLKLAWEQIRSPLVWVLVIAGGLAAILGRPTDGIFIGLVVLINTGIGILQDFRASQALAALGELIPRHCHVLRNGEKVLLDANQLVPGDVIYLSAGDQVPADLRILSCQALRSIEAALTGESTPSEKDSRVLPINTPLAERKNMLFSGSLIVSGSAVGLACATGLNTQLGQISALLSTVQSPETPLTRILHRLGQRLTVFIFFVSLALLGIGLWRGLDLIKALLSAISLAVAAIPEGLPALITMILAVGVHRMAQQNAVVKDLPAVEALGSTTVICTDKTGTLTQNLMVVTEAWIPDELLRIVPNAYRPEPALFTDKAPASWRVLAEVCMLCNNASLIQEAGLWSCRGDPTEGALLAFGARCGVSLDCSFEFSRIDEMPFDSDHRLMAVVVEAPEGVHLLVKGSVEELLPHCTADPSLVIRIQSEASRMARKGLRVLGCARALRESAPIPIAPQSLGPLTFLGLVAMEDPPRPEAKTAIAACRNAGICVKMITGDHPVTALAIAKALELTSNEIVLTGAELEKMAPEEFDHAAITVDLYARISASQKLLLIESLQRAGEVVAMTGDGVNDGPALRRADVGVAMGLGGTAVAREAADLILLDDRFATIEKAVEEGRRIFDNLVKSLAFLLPTNFGLALILFIGIQVMPIQDGILQLPLEPLQVLWVNLVVAITLGLPLAFEPAEPHIMNRPPRTANTPLLSNTLKAKGLVVAFVVVSVSFGLFACMLKFFQAPLAQAQTVALHGVVLVQIVALLDARVQSGSLWSSLSQNPWILRGIGILFSLQLLITFFKPMQKILGTASISYQQSISLIVLFILMMFLTQLQRRFFRAQ